MKSWNVCPHHAYSFNINICIPPGCSEFHQTHPSATNIKLKCPPMVNIFDYGTRFTLIFTFEFHIKSMTDIYYYDGVKWRKWWQKERKKKLLKLVFKYCQCANAILIIKEIQINYLIYFPMTEGKAYQRELFYRNCFKIYQGRPPVPLNRSAFAVAI